MTPDGHREPHEVASVPAREPAYMHSFALTDRYAVLFDQPFTANPLKLALGKRSFIENYEWKPERGMRFLVIDRQTGELRSTSHADAFFVFHSVNAFEEDGELVVDLVAYEDASIIDDLYLANLRAARDAVATGKLRRYRLPLDGGPARSAKTSATSRSSCRGSTTGRAAGATTATSTAPASAVAASSTSWSRSTCERREASHWHETGRYPGEPVFVARPGAEGEDDGVLLSVVLDAAAERSFLLVLDARDLSEIARAEAPHHIPFGFHGDFRREMS